MICMYVLLSKDTFVPFLAYLTTVLRKIDELLSSFRHSSTRRYMLLEDSKSDDKMVSYYPSVSPTVRSSTTREIYLYMDIYTYISV